MIAKSFGYARNGMRGGFSFKLTDNGGYPRLRIKHIDSTKAFISFANSVDEYGRKLTFKGNFLDLRTLIFALTNESHTLESAGNLFGADVVKVKAEQHKPITSDYIGYNIQDVDATYALYLKAKAEFDLYGLDIPATKGYSRHPETLRWQGKLKALYVRHEKLCVEMQMRGFRHNSPLDPELAVGWHLQDEFVDPVAEQQDILRKKGCECKV